MSLPPVVVIGAGPQGLAAAAHLRERGLEAIVLERGSGPGAAVSEWGHVRLFSPWDELIDSAAGRLLEGAGWTRPGAGYPTGANWVQRYLAPLASALGDSVRFRTTVTGVSRSGRDKVVTADRSTQPFIVHTLDAQGNEDRILARAVLDASGTWSQPNPMGADGLPALGERTAGERVSYRIPTDVERFAGRHVLVVGAGHSAIHAVIRLSGLVRRHPGTTVTWALRRVATDAVFGGGEADDLAERAALGTRAKQLVEDGLVTLVTGFRVAAIHDTGSGATVTAEDGRAVTDVAHVIALTGFRPDTSILSELRIDLDPALEAVAGIADEIDPHLHSCGTVAATGARQLTQPEEGFFIVGAKSYGRAPTFLALTGYEQVRSVVAHLAGDHEGAARNELVLPETGVCGGSASFDGGGCCAAPVLQIGTRGAAPMGA
ncbi:SidA/IucD/PvdA family monooxygenase [Microbacterium caowuchunii]|uniref:NAD(P)-binding domain-containing protein n=1 Tax=Microbacterium caowuchunii TaxID=2614638 RepID=UPI001247D88A|nr:NAD(P)-binding domain-containing protein [Microbacterium caowuchunii]QEV99982.1 SidA/IucD/PvdA family monooxygenase [Microbacterium caowuchunii]